MNIDLNTLQGILFDGNDVQGLIYNGVTLWTKRVTPTPSVDYSQEYFTVTSWLDSNTVTFKRGYSSVNMYISTDKENWTQISSNTTSRTLNKGQSLYFKGNNSSLASTNNTSYCSNIYASKFFEVSGNIQSLLWGDSFIGKTETPNTSSSYVFYGLFYNSTNLISARNLILPITTYNTWIYERFFQYCTNLIYAPKELPEQTSQGNNTLIWMFGSCSKLQETPVVRLTQTCTGDNWVSYVIQNSTALKRTIFLLNYSYPSVPSGCIVYKSSSNTYTTGRVFSDDPSDYVHIWAEPDIQYGCYIEGCSDYYQIGDTVTLKATGVGDNTFNGWYENGVLVSSDSTYSFTASTDRNLTVKVKAKENYTITVSSNDNTMGTASGGGTYLEESVINLTAATSGNAYKFVGWYLNNSLVSTYTSYSITVTGNASYEARFAAKAVYTITTAVNDNTMGTASGAGTYYEDSSVTLVASSNSGYKFVGWYSNSVLVSSSASYTFTPTASATYTATFEVNLNNYTELKSISYNSNYAQYWYYQYFNTGINTSETSGTLEIRIIVSTKGNEGTVTVGHMGGDTPGGSYNYNKAFRLFWESYLFVDVGNGRQYSTSNRTSYYTGTWSDFTWTTNWTNKTFTLKNTGASNNIYSGSFSAYANDCPIFIATGPAKFQACSITKDNVLVFDGVAALDNNNRPCIYDKVSGNFIYAQGTYSADSNFAIEYFS